MAASPTPLNLTAFEATVVGEAAAMAVRESLKLPLATHEDAAAAAGRAVRAALDALHEVP